ncbi:hypothetical protein Maes01_00606 [Microbulbifer aestuariivivens]|uniref:Transferrin-binding protein B C-lobe/N-lobe beta barrel domain-containing protein n=1 Tax=Microbulbifer aestuariivivens TaxID=1908308 RepID=A0ABP9WLQ9_9GAMM
MISKGVLQFVFVGLMALHLGACSGGGDDGSNGDGGSAGGQGNGPTPSQPDPVADQNAEGLWIGETDTGMSINGLVLDDGQMYILYFDPEDEWGENVPIMPGFIHGYTTVNGDEFSATSIKDYAFEANEVFSGSVSAVISEEASLVGEIDYVGGNSVAFSASYDTAYERSPFIGDMEGEFEGTAYIVDGWASASISVESTGAFAGASLNGCEVSGVIYERGSGNVYNAEITFGADPCIMPNETLSGIVYFDSGYFYMAAAHQDQTNAILFLAKRPGLED